MTTFHSENSNELTPEQLCFLMFEPCTSKMRTNSFKENPLGVDIFKLLRGEALENVEFIEAYQAYMNNPTKENLQKVIMEAADKINFILFMVGSLVHKGKTLKR